MNLKLLINALAVVVWMSAVSLAGRAIYKIYQNAHSVTQVTSATEVQERIDTATNTLFILVRNDEEGSKKMAEYFLHAATALHGEATFLSVDSSLGPSPLEMAVPSVIVVNRQVNVAFTLSGVASSQERVVTAFRNILTIINAQKNLSGK